VPRQALRPRQKNPTCRDVEWQGHYPADKPAAVRCAPEVLVSPTQDASYVFIIHRLWLLYRDKYHYLFAIILAVPFRAPRSPFKKNTPNDVGYFSWWLLPDSNWGHKALQASALPTELKSHARPCYSTDTSRFFQQRVAIWCNLAEAGRFTLQALGFGLEAVGLAFFVFDLAHEIRTFFIKFIFLASQFGLE
jgi:hypothetical protein